MVRKRSFPESDSKMPVKSSPKDKTDSQAQQELDSASVSDKDSQFTSKGTVWSRELRNRFVIANNKRSLRFTNEVRPGRHMRSCRMAITNRQRYTLSQSDDDEDDHIFTARSSRRLQHHKRSLSSPEPGPGDERHTSGTKRPRTNSTVNGHTSKSNHEEEGIHEEDAAGIRRSTRQRKLKYENYSDSWIVGAQTLKGYPQDNYVDLRDVYTRSPLPSRRAKAIKHEPIEEEDDDEEEDEEHLKAGEVTDEGDTEEGDNGETRNVVVKKRSERLRSGDKERNEEQDVDEDQVESVANDGGFEDMYSRVKRKRTRRSIYDGEMLNRRRQRERKCVQRQGNFSESESSSEDEAPPQRRNREREEIRKYHLRETKPIVKRFQITDVEESAKRRPSRSIRAVICGSMRRHRRLSSSSISSSSSAHFDRKKPKLNKSRSRMPHLLAGAEANEVKGKAETGGRLADIDPISLDTSIRFSHVGGLEDHVHCLQEMVVFPMMYAEVFRKYHVTPPKGVLFHGPPGTGKTLIARALANECSQGQRKVTFFMRKGADCLSKWVGESERQLRLLFEEAHQARPSIIFFDELDGLAPVRSAKQDQIHASIVSTLLALMDGLDDRGEIVVIGATNRVDAIDPALRRPGRFDRELLFPLPANKERQEILKIHMSKWQKPLPLPLLESLAEKAAGYCGSDLRALCSEAVIQALRRHYPQIYNSNKKLLVDPDKVQVERCDFEMAQRSIVPSSHRVAPGFGRKLPKFLEPLLANTVDGLTARVRSVFHCGFVKGNKSTRVVKSPRLLIKGQRKATSIVTAALIHRMEFCPVHTLDLATIYSESARSPEEATVQVLNEVRCNIPSILYVPGMAEFWRTVGPTVRAIFQSLLCQMDPTLPILLLATAVAELPTELKPMFSAFRGEVYSIQPPTDKQKQEFFKSLLLERPLIRPPRERKKEPLEELPEAPPTPPPKLNEDQLQKLYSQEEHKLRELRIFLRQICSKLARNKIFYMFSKPVDINEVPDYLNIIREPMDLETMMTKIDLHKYNCAQDFLNDVELICANALEYNPDRDPADKLIRHRACYLRDTAYALIKAEMDSDFEETCKEIRKSRQERGAVVDKFAPEFIQTAAMVEQQKLLMRSVQETPQNSPTANTAADNKPPSTATSSVRAKITKQNLNKNSLSLSNERRRKKKPVWCRGILKKPVKAVKAKSLFPSTTLMESKTKKDEELEVSSMDDTINSEMDSQLHSTPLKQNNPHISKPSGGGADVPLVNGVEGLSSEDEEDDRLAVGNHEESIVGSDCSVTAETVAKPGKRSPGKQLVVNKSKLSRLLGDAVNVTRDITSVEVLIDLFAQLKHVISSYHRLWDRSKLPEDLENELRRFSSEHSEEVLDHPDEQFNLSRDDNSVV